MADDEQVKKKRAKQVPDWRRYGDPRNIAGHFRPKNNLKKLYGKGKKWTRESLATAMGIKDPSVISKWVTGKRYMSDKDIVRCSVAAGVSVTWLLDLSNNPNSQGWPARNMVERERILAKIKGFSDGKTWEELAQDYHAGVQAVSDHEREIERLLLKESGCKNIEEFEAMTRDEYEASIYLDIERYVYAMVAPPPWGVIWVEEDEGFAHQEEIDVGDVQKCINEIERLFPGDRRDLVHLAHVMLEETMKYYPSKCLEEMTGLLNQASRMLASS